MGTITVNSAQVNAGFNGATVEFSVANLSATETIFNADITVKGSYITTNNQIDRNVDASLGGVSLTEIVDAVALPTGFTPDKITILTKNTPIQGINTSIGSFNLLDSAGNPLTLPQTFNLGLDSTSEILKMDINGMGMKSDSGSSFFSIDIEVENAAGDVIVPGTIIVAFATTA